jgi:hypothetical protein
VQEFTDFTAAGQGNEEVQQVEQRDMDMFGWDQFDGVDEDEQEDALKVCGRGEG